MDQKVIALTIDEADILSDILYYYATTAKERLNILKGNQKEPYIPVLEKEIELCRDTLEQLDEDTDLIFKSEEYFDQFKSLIRSLLNTWSDMEGTTEVSERLIDQERIALRTVYTKLG